MLHRENPIVLIDGECVLCNRFAKFVIAQDPGGVFLFAPLRGNHARELCRERGVLTPPAGTMVVVEGDRLLVRSEAVLAVLDRLPFPYPQGASALRRVPRGLRDALYSVVAVLRRFLAGRTSSCGLITPKERARFLD